MRTFTFAMMIAGATTALLLPATAEAKSRHHHSRHSAVRIAVVPQYAYPGYRPAYYQPTYGYQPYYGYQPSYGAPSYYRTSYGGYRAHSAVSHKRSRHKVRRHSRHH